MIALGSGARTSQLGLDLVGSTSSTLSRTGGLPQFVTLNVSYRVLGTPAPIDTPNFHYYYKHEPQEVQLSNRPAAYEVDYGSLWYVDPIPSILPEERWATAPSLASGNATKDEQIIFTYYHEFQLTTSYVEFGGVAPFQPTLVLFQGGEEITFPMLNQSYGWADVGSTWDVNQTFFGSSGLERWWAENATGVITTAGTLKITYFHQYLLTMFILPGFQAGSTVPSSVENWEIASSVVSISARPANGYIFGSWSCSGRGCYAGLQNSSQIAINAPANEAARFAAVETVIVQVEPGGVQQFVVVDGETVQVPAEFSWAPNSTHTILALSNVSCGVVFISLKTCVYQLKDWTVDGLVYNEKPLTVTADKPKTITAAFQTDYFNPSESILVAVIVILMLALFWRRKRRLPKAPPSVGFTSPSGLSCHVGFLSDLGRNRSNNEDSILALELLTTFESKPNAIILSGVADGVGGSQKGEVASKLTLVTLVTRAVSLLMDSGSTDRIALLKASVEAANDDVVKYGMMHRESEGLASTLVAAVVERSMAYIANVGDSRAYLVNRGGIRQLSKDHSQVQELVDAGRISSEQSRHYVGRNIITRAVGASTDVQVDTYTVSLAAGDRILLCTDGLWESVTDVEIHKIVMQSQDPQAACEKLVALANERGGKDNISSVIVEFKCPVESQNVQLA